MARPVHANAAATKQRILDTARSLFSARGAGDTSMRDIAGGAGVTVATVHHYFGGKEALYQASVSAMYEELDALKEELLPLFAGQVPMDEALSETIRRTYAFARAHLPAARLTMRVILDTGEVDPIRRTENLIPLVQDGAELLAAAMGLSPDRVRMCLLSLNYLIVRYALVAPRELALVTGVSKEISDDNEDQTDAIAKVEAHLVQIGRELFGLADGPTAAPRV